MTTAPTFNCQHAYAGRCILSSTLAGIPVLLDGKACAACLRCDRPRDLNGVVCSRAIWALRKSDLPVMPELFKCVQESQREGPGSELKAILARWAKPDDECGCNAKIAQMNSWGIEGCRHNMETIVGWIHTEARERRAWLKLVPCRWYFRRLVKRAIRNAGRTRIRNQSGNPAR